MGSGNNWFGVGLQRAPGLRTTYTPEQLQMRYSYLGIRPLNAIIRHQPQSNLGAYEQKHRAISESSAEDEGMREGFTGMLNTFLVGCDPEFVALDSCGQQMNLSAAFSANGEIGYDHGGRVGELRPEPTRGTYALTKRLQRLIKSPIVERVGASKLRAGARVNQDTLGGHVHLGVPVAKATNMIPALDRFTQVLEALDILPQTECSARRASGSGYGRFGEVRDSNGHIEYRTMASWLMDPKVAFLCLTGAKLAASDPAGTVAALPSRDHNFNALVEWFRAYRSKDINARRALEKVLSLGHKAIQVYPDVDFRERWRELGL